MKSRLHFIGIIAAARVPGVFVCLAVGGILAFGTPGCTGKKGEVTPVKSSANSPDVNLSESSLSDGLKSTEIRHQIGSILTESNALGGVIRMDLENGKRGEDRLSAAIARSFLKKLLVQENDKDFGPFVVDASRVRKNLDLLLQNFGGKRERVPQEFQESILRLSTLISQFIDTLENEQGPALSGELKRARQIQNSIQSEELQKAFQDWMQGS